MNVNVKSLSKHGIGCFFGKKFLMIVSLLFMLTLFSSLVVSGVNGYFFTDEPPVVVETEAELVTAINTSPDEEYTIVISKDIMLEKSLEIPDGKRIILIGNVSDICLVGTDGFDTIIVKSGGYLRMVGYIVVTHAKGDTGRGIYVERGGTCILQSTTVSGNRADNGGGVYNEGTFELRQADDSLGLIANNVATLGGGVYNKGTFRVFGGCIKDNVATLGGGVYNAKRSLFDMTRSEITFNKATDKGGGVYNLGVLDMKSGCIDRNSADKGGGVYNLGTFNMAKSYGLYDRMMPRGCSIGFNTATLAGGVYNAGTFDMPEGAPIYSNTALSGESVNVVNETLGEWQLYLLVITVALVGIVAGLFFYRSKRQKQLIVKNGLGGVDEGV
ncbi:MAG: hypothetical protein FWD52_02220 [Candidatus Bathyarchaeota archaeon]|nr:hypothetical protein [Candidatus Termiticorpusculum sp.]